VLLEYTRVFLVGILGGFKRSSQHLNEGDCDDDTQTTVTSGWTAYDALTRPATNSTT
jgi:hypothetical protein